MFRRVNDAIAFEDSGDVNQGKLADITSETGTIVFLAPSANVGSVDSDQNFVQRADEGIYYGLNSGRFFSDDIGATPLLQTIPTDTLASSCPKIALARGWLARRGGDGAATRVFSGRKFGSDRRRNVMFEAISAASVCGANGSGGHRPARPLGHRQVGEALASCRRASTTRLCAHTPAQT